jgi:RsiW-degrading membrane proteinase PrsW (M82 family)
MPLPISILAIAVPTFLYAWLVRRIDRYEQEPVKYIVFAFAWGAMPAIILGLISQLILDLPTQAVLGDGTATDFIGTAIVAPITEEIAKGIAVAIVYFARRREFDGWVDGIVYGSSVGFGFAFVENIGYLAGTENAGEWAFLFVLRVLVFGFMHGFWTSLTGIGFGVARHSHKPRVKAMAPVLGLLAAIAGHAIHNGSLVLAQVTSGSTFCLALLNYVVILALMVGLGMVAARNDSAALKTYLLDEVPDTISPEDYAALSNLRNNAQARFFIAPQHRRAFIQTAAELAQKKQQLLKMGLEGKVGEEIDQLRNKLKSFRGTITT